MGTEIGIPDEMSLETGLVSLIWVPVHGRGFLRNFRGRISSPITYLNLYIERNERGLGSSGRLEIMFCSVVSWCDEGNANAGSMVRAADSRTGHKRVGKYDYSVF